MRVTKTLKVKDCCAPSDKYPAYGVRIDFEDKFFVEYPSGKSLPVSFKDGVSYEMTFSYAERTDFGGTYKKMSRLSNIKEI